MIRDIRHTLLYQDTLTMTNIPLEILGLEIASYLDARDQVSLAKTCRQGHMAQKLCKPGLTTVDDRPCTVRMAKFIHEMRTRHGDYITLTVYPLPAGYVTNKFRAVLVEWDCTGQVKSYSDIKAWCLDNKIEFNPHMGSLKDGIQLLFPEC